jgi:hypothetical protein
MRRSLGAEGATLRKAGVVVVMAGMLLTVAWALLPAPAARANDGCPHTAGRVDHGGASGSFTAQAGGTVTWNTNTTTNQITVTVTGTAVICLKSSGNETGQITLTNQTLVLGCPQWCNQNGVIQQVSHISDYPGGTTTSTSPPTTSTTPPTTSTSPPTTSTTPPTTSTTPPTTSTPPSTTPPTTTSVQPTTVTPPDDTTPPDETSVQPTTVTPPGGTAFTGLENVIPLGVIALTMMTAGSGLLWAGTRRNRKNDEE